MFPITELLLYFALQSGLHCPALSEAHGSALTALLTLDRIAPLARTERGESIGVEVSVELKALVGTWLEPDADRDAVEERLQRFFARCLNRWFRFWQFEERGGQPVRLKLGLRKGGDDEAVVGLTLLENETAVFDREATVWEPGTYGGGCASSPWDTTGILLSSFARLIAASETAESLKQQIQQRVALTEGGYWWPAKERTAIVLALPWEPVFKQLSESKFEVGLYLKDGSTARVGASGMAAPYCYPVPPRCKQDRGFEALSLRPEESGERVGRVLLKEFIRASSLGAAGQ